MSTKIVTRRFDSFDAFVEASKVVPPKQDSGSSRKNSKSFSGTENFEEAVTLASEGWAEGAAKALALRGSIDAAVRQIVTARQARYAWDVTGDVVDVGRFLTGEPECWVTQERDAESPSASVVRIVANLAASGAVSQGSLFARGAVILATVDVLESLGHRVELWIAHGCRCPQKGIFQQFALVKHASQPLDADRIAFCLCHAACLRRLAFSVFEQQGFLPNVTYPCGVQFDGDAIVTNEAYRGHDFSQQELLSEVASLCEKCGIAIPVDEIKALVASK